LPVGRDISALALGGDVAEAVGRPCAIGTATGPDLISTLEAYYRHDLSRARAAASLNIHPRTLDYRLRRAQDLTGVDPHSVQGVRVLTTAITRAAAGG
jgi:sugar diacid utilization regulator